MLVTVVSAGLFALPSPAQTNGIFADIATSLGTFTVELDYVHAPRATANFIGLATGEQAWRDPEHGGIRSNDFFAGTRVHLITYTEPAPGTTNVLGFRSGLRPVRTAAGATNWTGGPGYTLLDEATNGLSHSNGVIALVHQAPHTGATEFIVTRTNAAAYWDGLQTVFGRVASNLAVVEAICAIPTAAGVPQTNVAVSNVTIRRVGGLAEGFNLASQNLPQVTASEMALRMESGTNLSAVAYDVPPQSEYFIIHTTNLLVPAWSFNSIGFNSQTVSVRQTNTFLAQPGAFGFEHFFQAAQAAYPVFSALSLGSGIVFAAEWTDGTVYQYQIDLRGGNGSSTGVWWAISNAVVVTNGNLLWAQWRTRTANCTEFYFSDDDGNTYDYTLGFAAAGATTGRYYLDLTDWWGFSLGWEFGPCEYADWTPGANKARSGRSTGAGSTVPTGRSAAPAYNTSDWPRRSAPAPGGATRAPGFRPGR